MSADATFEYPCPSCGEVLVIPIQLTTPLHLVGASELIVRVSADWSDFDHPCFTGPDGGGGEELPEVVNG